MKQPNNAASHPLAQLVTMRVKEFIREPAAIFWVYVFPLLMMIALGVAFRERPVEKSSVVVEDGPMAQHIATALGEDERFQVRTLEEAESRRALRTGQSRSHRFATDIGRIAGLLL